MLYYRHYSYDRQIKFNYTENGNDIRSPSEMSSHITNQFREICICEFGGSGSSLTPTHTLTWLLYGTHSNSTINQLVLNHFCSFSSKLYAFNHTQTDRHSHTPKNAHELIFELQIFGTEFNSIVRIFRICLRTMHSSANNIRFLAPVLSLCHFVARFNLIHTPSKPIQEFNHDALPDGYKLQSNPWKINARNSHTWNGVWLNENRRVYFPQYPQCNNELMWMNVCMSVVFNVHSNRNSSISIIITKEPRLGTAKAPISMCKIKVQKFLSTLLFHF